MLSISLEKSPLTLKLISLRIFQATPPPCLFRSDLTSSYPSIFISPSSTDPSSFDSVIPITVALVFLAIFRSSSSLDNRLLIFK